jgi:tRNA 5-methylaminomethyl-2-thiouridine biosynthesis bifunctional protein
MYDVAIVGAGINGCCSAYELSNAKKKVVVFDREIAAGGSGAAGAFISPKFSKSGELKDIIHKSFLYSMKFYKDKFPLYFRDTKLIHIAKDEKDDEILKVYKKTTTLKLLEHNSFERQSISINSGIVDAKAICEAMLSGIEYKNEFVETLVYDDGYWVINETYTAKEVVLATGAYKSVLNEPYIKLRGVWGHRIDIKSSTQNKNSFHQFVSISNTHNDKIAIGATHNVHYHPQTSKESYDIQEGRVELLQKASKTLQLEDVKVLKDYTGLRSGSFDYMPMVGRLVISLETLKDKSIRFKVKKPDFDKYTYYPNLYMINGSGGYGFVLAPYLANILKEHIVSSKIIDKSIVPARFFARWAKKL